MYVVASLALSLYRVSAGDMLRKVINFFTIPQHFSSDNSLRFCILQCGYPTVEDDRGMYKADVVRLPWCMG